MYAREPVGRGGRSSGTSPRWYAAHHASFRAVRNHHVRVTHCVLPEATVTDSRPRRRCPAAIRWLSAFPTAVWPYGVYLASVFTEMSLLSGSRSMYAAIAPTRGGRCAQSSALRGSWSKTVRLP